MSTTTRLALAALIALFVLGLTGLQAGRHRAFFHYEYEDDALYAQMLDNVGQGQLFKNTIHPIERPSHFMPAWLLLWPLYALMGGGMGAVFLLKALITGLGALFVALLARSAGHSNPRALLWAGLYLLYPPTLTLCLGTFRLLSLAVTPLLAAMWAFHARRFWTFIVAALSLLLLREDLGLTVAMFSVVAWRRHMPKRWLVTPALFGIIWAAVVIGFILPHILPRGYDEVILRSNLVAGGLWAKLSMITEPTHLLALCALLLPVAFLPLLAWESLIGAAGLAAILLNQSPLLGNLTHLAAPAVGAFFGAAVIASGRFRGRWVMVGVCLGTLAAHLQPWVPPTLSPPPTPAAERDLSAAFSPLDPAYSAVTAHDRLRWEALRLIPPHASVGAVGHFLPALSPRPVLYEWGHPHTRFANVDWLALESGSLFAGAGDYVSISPSDLAHDRRILEHSGVFEPVFDRDGILVLRRRAPGDLTDPLRSFGSPGTTARLHRGGHRDPRPPPPGPLP